MSSERVMFSTETFPATTFTVNANPNLELCEGITLIVVSPTLMAVMTPSSLTVAIASFDDLYWKVYSSLSIASSGYKFSRIVKLAFRSRLRVLPCMSSALIHITLSSSLEESAGSSLQLIKVAMQTKNRKFNK